MGWPWSNQSGDYSASFPARIKEFITLTPAAKAVLHDLSSFSTAQTMFVTVACTCSFALGWRSHKATGSWKRITTMADISSLGAHSPWLRGRVVSVSDGDTFRLLHVPTWWHSSRLPNNGEKKLSETTLAIRICTVDTPETSKFGQAGQPFGQQAKEYLSEMVLDRMVRIRLLEKDQYGRGVAEVQRPGLFGNYFLFSQYLDQEMLRAGLAEVYQGSGAVYGHKGKEAYLAMEETARANKKGMWSQKNIESAAEYKARVKAEG